jgi:hypothetical protein
MSIIVIDIDRLGLFVFVLLVKNYIWDLLLMDCSLKLGISILTTIKLTTRLTATTVSAHK